MKLRKQIKNRAVAVAMLAVVLFCSFSLSKPDVAYASTNDPDGSFKPSENYDFLETRYDFRKLTAYKFLNFNGNIVTFNNPAGSNCIILISNKENNINYIRYDYQWNNVDGYDMTEVSDFYDQELFTVNDKTYYINVFVSNYGLVDNEPYYSYSGLLGRLYSVTDPSFNVSYRENWRKLLTDYFNNSLDSSYVVDVGEAESTDPSTWQGGQDNPIKKDDFGYPQIYNSTYIHNDPNNIETLDKLYSGQDFQWKKKTTTGFDLTNNDYNYTYIECKVKANYQYNDKYSGKGSWHNFDSYGEMGNLGKVRAESLSHYYTFQEFQKALPITSNELPDHKMRAIKSSAVYYFRVVCMKTNSTVVIPDEKDCKYYSGPWRSVTVTKINGKDGTSVVEDGEFDENGDWKKDDNSGDNGKDIDNGSAEGDDLSDASDKAHETINSNANKSTLDLDSAKAFINQVADVPKMIADIFSFLPDWVKYSFAFGFALIPILIIFKLIRG